MLQRVTSTSLGGRFTVRRSFHIHKETKHCIKFNFKYCTVSSSLHILADVPDTAGFVLGSHKWPFILFPGHGANLGRRTWSALSDLFRPATKVIPSTTDLEVGTHVYPIELLAAILQQLHMYGHSPSSDTTPTPTIRFVFPALLYILSSPNSLFTPPTS